MTSRDLPRLTSRHLPPSSQLATGVVLPDELGYTTKELRAGGITASELRKGKVYFRVEEWKEGGWMIREVRPRVSIRRPLRGAMRSAALASCLRPSHPEVVGCRRASAAARRRLLRLRAAGLRL